MPSDARISTGLPSHPKTKKLIRRIGEGAGWRLVCLFLWAASNRSDGDLSGMSDEDIELAIDWQGDQGAFVRELVAIGFLDGEEGERSIHDWEQHNPWAAGSEKRAEKSRWAALCKQYGRAEAARMMPDYAARLPAATSKQPEDSQEGAPGVPVAVPNNANAVPMALPESASGTRVAETGSAPSPSPSPLPLPSPLPNPNTPLAPQGGKRRRAASGDDEESPEFAAFYAAYPRKMGRQAAWRAWKTLAPDAALQAKILGALAAQRPHLDRRENGRFIPHASTWLNQGRWDDEIPGAKSSVPVNDSGQQWWEVAGFTHPAEAANERCHVLNYREFRDGRRISEVAA